MFFQPDLPRYGAVRPLIVADALTSAPAAAERAGHASRRAAAIAALLICIAPDVDARHGIVPTVRTLMDLDVTCVNNYNYWIMRQPTVADIGQSHAGGSNALKP